MLITGTPGTGKTTVAGLLSDALGAPYVDVGGLLSAWGLLKPDRQRFAHVVTDVEEAVRRLRESLPRSFVADTHAVSLFHGVELDAVVVLRRDPRQLLVELARRGWPKPKIYENVVAELLDVVYVEAQKLDVYLAQIDVSGLSPGYVARVLASCLPRLECPREEVDWIGRMGEEAYYVLLEYEALVGAGLALHSPVTPMHLPLTDLEEHGHVPSVGRKPPHDPP